MGDKSQQRELLTDPQGRAAGGQNGADCKATCRFMTGPIVQACGAFNCRHGSKYALLLHRPPAVRPDR